MSLAYTLTPSSMNILLDGRMRTISITHMNFASVVSIVKQLGKTTDPSVVGDKLDALRELIDIKLFIAKVTEGRVQVGDTAVYFDGKPCHNVIATRILKMLGEGFDIRPMARFMDKLMSNPLESARNELYEWLEVGGLPITADGDFLAFKKVREDYKSYHDGVTDNSIGTKPSVPRDVCDTDRTNTCSSGLHFCSFAYLPSYMGSSGRVVICKINPADVTAIPNDYNTTKGRAWTYEIIGEVPQDECESAFPESVVSAFGTYEGEVDDELANYDEDYGYDAYDTYDDDAHSSDDEHNTATEVVEENVDIERAYQIDRDALLAACAGDTSALVTAFVWDVTPQGGDYWADIYRSNEIPHDAELILDSWAKQLGLSRTPSVDTPVFTLGKIFKHGGKEYTALQVQEVVRTHGQRGASRLLGIPRSTIQDWLAAI